MGRGDLIFQDLGERHEVWHFAQDEESVAYAEKEIMLYLIQKLSGVDRETAFQAMKSTGVKKPSELLTRAKDLEKVLHFDLGVWQTHLRQESLLLLQPEILSRLADFPNPASWYIAPPAAILPPEKSSSVMRPAAAVLGQALRNEEGIAVFADYDVDGITSAEIFRRTAQLYGKKDFYAFADKRPGVQFDFIIEAERRAAKNLILFDCGASQDKLIEEAQRRGMKVFVVDHHESRGSAADFSINVGKKYTSSQLAWKLAWALQEAMEGKTRPEHRREALYLASLGALADMASVRVEENRAFFWGALNYAPEGVERLASLLGEKLNPPGVARQTIAALNIAKRTHNFPAEKVFALLRAEGSEANKAALLLLEEYQQIKETGRKMSNEAILQGGKAYRKRGVLRRKNPEQRIASAVLSNFDEYAGYSGVCAWRLSRAAAKPALVFVRSEVDDSGQAIYRFSSRNITSVPYRLGELLQRDDLRKLCLVQKGGKQELQLGGHRHVVSGACLEKNISDVEKIFENWAQGKGESFFLESNNKKHIKIDAVVENASQLALLEAQAEGLAPFSEGGRERKHRPLYVMVLGMVVLSPDEISPGCLSGKLIIEGGSRDILFPSRKKAPLDVQEWLLPLGQSEPYLLRFWRSIQKAAAERSGELVFERSD